MDDLIKRQAAIDALDKDPMGGLNYNRILNNLPSAQKTGHWIHYDEQQFDYKCSECGYEVWDNSDFPSYYCPNCGAYMKGEENETNSNR